MTADPQENAVVENAVVPFSGAATQGASDEAPGSASARAQQQQDAQAAAGRGENRWRGKARAAYAAAAAFFARNEERTILTGTNEDGVSRVLPGDDEIGMSVKKGKPPSERQVKEALLEAQRRGWNKVYVYDAKGQANIEMAKMMMAVALQSKDKQLQALIRQVHVCDNPLEYKKTLAEMKDHCRKCKEPDAAPAAQATARQPAPA